MLRSLRSTIAFLFALFAFLPSTWAIRLIESKSLNPCQDNSNFTASLFNVVFTPDNKTLTFDVVGVSSISGNVTAQLEIIAYGYTAINQTLEPCGLGWAGLCPMSTGQINIRSNIVVGESVLKYIPGITYSVPDIDGLVRIYIRMKGSDVSVACVEAELSNGQTVDQKAVGWATAVVAGLGLIASGITSGLGHTNTAAHVAANALSLFGFFQAQAMIGMTAVTLPPIVQSWTQDFQWSMGIIRLGFLQRICTWYQRATGGKPTTYLSTLTTQSVEVQKRSLDIVMKLVQRGVHGLTRRVVNTTTGSGNTKVVVVRGIDRVGFRAGIEQTNIFLTGLIFFIFICAMVVILVALFKGYCEIAAKARWMKTETFLEFRNGWKIVMKGILFRLVIIGFPQMCVLCLWELVERDSAAEVTLALVMFIGVSFALGWGALKVIRLAKRSVMMHKNPAYVLYSDPSCLNKWGFLYVQYRATAYWFILPMLAYILLKAIFIAFCQTAQVVQAVGLVIIEAVALIGISTVRPWMDKKTNALNIAIAVFNLLNAIFLLVFTSIFNQPALVTGIMGVIFALYNVIFALVLLLIVFISSIYAILSKNPDARYQPMRDDRGSFIKSQQALTTELDALGATARGDSKSPFGHSGMGDDDASYSSDSLDRQKHNGPGVATATSTANTDIHDNHTMFPSEKQGRRGPENYEPAGIIDHYNRESYADHSYSGYESSPAPTPSPQPYGYGNGNNYSRPGMHGSPSPYQPQQQRPPQNFRQQNSSSPWQRGAGYD